MPKIFSLPVFSFDFLLLFLLISYRGGYVHENYDPKGKCVFPYEGNLCNQCTEGYAKSTSRKDLSGLSVSDK